MGEGYKIEGTGKPTSRNFTMKKPTAADAKNFVI
jgi:hypothetical protein